jgi:hypothetical protein
MQRLAVSIAFLAAVSAVSAISACSNQECTYLNDCPSAQVCSPDGSCIADERPVLAARNGNGEDAFDDDGGNDGIDIDGIGNDIGEAGTPDDVTMSGRIGPVGGFEGRAELNMFEDAEFGLNVIDVTAESEQGYGLFILSLANGIDGLPVGTTTFGLEGIDGGATYVQLCSDSEDGSMHFDGIAEETVVTVTPTDDEGVEGVEGVEVDVTTTITEGFDGWSYDGAEPTVLHVSFTLAG